MYGREYSAELRDILDGLIIFQNRDYEITLIQSSNVEVVKMI